jgi:DNA-binding beta-propeller fold protein YncE
MKTLLSIILLSLINIAAAQQLVPKWESEPVFNVPESVYFDAETELVYVSNIVGNPSEKDKQGFISLVEKDGKIKNLKWVTGLYAPKGMAIQNGKLYVTDIDRIAIINITKGEIEKFIPVPEAKFLNDMVFDNNGTLYISGTGTNAIYKLRNGQIEKWLSDNPLIAYPNGLAFEHNKVLIGTDKGLVSIDPDTKETTLLIEHQGGIDGLIPLGNNKYIVSDWMGKTELISTLNEPIILRNTTDQKINSADLGFIKESNTILIPTFFDNRITALDFIEK